MKNWNVEHIARLMEECGRTALSLWRDPHPELKADQSIVTLADRQIEDFLTSELHREADEVYVIGEELVGTRSPEYFRHALANTAWIVDPIDGTAPYANGLPTWGVSIGYSRSHALREGAIFLPACGEFIISDSGKTYWGNCGDDPAKWRLAECLRELDVRRKPFSPASLICLSQRLGKYGRFNSPNPYHSTGSCVYAGVMLARGCYGAYINLAKLWDSAAVFPILKPLGFRALTKAGGDMMSLSISDELYNLDFASPTAFYARRHYALAPDIETSRKLLSVCEFPEDM